MPASQTLHCWQSLAGCGLLATSSGDVLDASAAANAAAHIVDGVGPRRRHPVSFSAETVTCLDGYRCVSSTAKFGTTHVSGEDVNNTPPYPDGYEWGCPHDGKWNPYTYDVGHGQEECGKKSKECLCVARASTDFKSEMSDGREVMIGKFRVDAQGTNPNPDSAEEELLHISPHYAMRELSDTFDPTDPNSDMGRVVAVPGKELTDKWRGFSSKMQNALDEEKEALEAECTQVEKMKSFSCGEGKGYSEPEAVRAISLIRRFQVLQNDCESMRENIVKVTPDDNGERFEGKVGARVLNCYVKPGVEGCQQLNCYNGPDDAKFRNNLKKFRSRMQACVHDQEAEKEEKTATASLGDIGVALGALLPRSPLQRKSPGIVLRTVALKSFL